MTLHDQRGRFERCLGPAVDWCAANDVNPNTLTILGFIVTAAAAISFYFSTHQQLWLLLLGAGLLLFGAMLDSMDGLLARATDQASPLGDYLDHAFDRFADVIVLLAFTFSVWVPLEVGLLAIVGTLLTSYMGTQAQAVGVGRDYGGLMGRADRLFLLIGAPVAEMILQTTPWVLPWGFNLVYIALAWIAIAGNITALQRFWASYRALAEDEKP